jgi:Cu-Zn family superoxide dismutase
MEAGMTRHESNVMAAAVLGVVCLVGWSQAHAQSPVTAKVELKDAMGQSVGTATVTAGPTSTQIALDLKNLPPGQHAVHVHQNPKCDAPDFATAGGHFNPEGALHGFENGNGPHAGDMPNFTVAADGTAKATVTNPRGPVGADGYYSVFGNGGTALVIHAMPDDMKTDPTGNAGARIACGAITR